ncbi:MAG: alpha-amylase [Chlorobiaceae bacterium]|jgi:glycosidase|nr:alpha-amylase [Chlorobiaceae bacterium]NTV16235.1 alpha-amylase [Chlorobiaceae bacterium]
MFPLVYEINTRIWLKKLSNDQNHQVTLINIPDEEFTFFANCGFDIVWLMGVWMPSQYSKAIATAHPGLRSSFLEHIAMVEPVDIASSPYSIPSYTVNEALGGKEGLLAFREKLSRYGIKLMLDFVPNHLALDNEYLPEHPEFFIPVSKAEQMQDPGSGFEYSRETYLAYGKDPYYDPWTDTLQLNYARKETRNMMTENLCRISELCDAVRCDMAMLILKSVFNTTWSNLGGAMKEEFWHSAITAVKRLYPDFLFLAESYWNKEWELQQQGFDFTYDKPFYDYISSSPVNVDKLAGHMQAQWEYQKHLCRFLENHDEPRAAEKFGLNNKAAALVLLTSPGMHLVHQDQMEGFRQKIPVQLVRQAPEACNIDLSRLYKELFSLQKKKVFQEGQIERLELNAANNSHCFGFQRFTAEEHAFVLANFSATGIAIEFQHPSLDHISIERLNVLSTASEKKTSDVHCAENVTRVNLSPHEGMVITC